MGMMKDFKEFAMRENVIDMAVGIIIGVAFGTVVKSLVNDVLMPPIGLLLHGVDFSNLFVVLKQGTKAPGPYAALVDANAAGAVTINYGLFINAIISFLIVAFAVFMVVRGINKLKREQSAEATTKGMPLLSFDHCNKGEPLPSLHIGTHYNVPRKLDRDLSVEAPFRPKLKFEGKENGNVGNTETA